MKTVTHGVVAFGKFKFNVVNLRLFCYPLTAAGITNIML